MIQYSSSDYRHTAPSHFASTRTYPIPFHRHPYSPNSNCDIRYNDKRTTYFSLFSPANEQINTFISPSTWKKEIFFCIILMMIYLCTLQNTGLTGFDSEMSLYVSMQ